MDLQELLRVIAGAKAMNLNFNFSVAFHHHLLESIHRIMGEWPGMVDEATTAGKKVKAQKWLSPKIPRVLKECTGHMTNSAILLVVEAGGGEGGG